MRRNMNAASPGTIRLSASSGPSTARRFSPAKIGKADYLPKRNISHDSLKPCLTVSSGQKFFLMKLPAASYGVFGEGE